MGVGFSDTNRRVPVRSNAPAELNGVSAPENECSGIVRLMAHRCVSTFGAYRQSSSKLSWWGSPWGLGFAGCLCLPCRLASMYIVMLSFCQSPAVTPIRRLPVCSGPAPPGAPEAGPERRRTTQMWRTIT